MQENKCQRNSDAFPSIVDSHFVFSSNVGGGFSYQHRAEKERRVWFNAQRYSKKPLHLLFLGGLNGDADGRMATAADLGLRHR
jgi:hypothetical protein